MVRLINDRGLSILKESEQCRLTAYPDPGSGDAPWTIGWGHTGKDVFKGKVITQQQADALLVQDSNAIASLLDAILPPVTNNQFSALVSFVYNIGIGNFKNSTMFKLIKAGNISGAADEFPKWNKSAGRVLNGLTVRRSKERELFLTPDSGD